MKKQIPLILNIPTPCTESWAEMGIVEQGRFCSHCQKTVTDITTMSDTQVVQLFQSQADTHCIRAFASQLNRPISLPPQAPTRFYRIAVALGLVLITASASEVFARPRAPLTEEYCLPYLSDNETTGDDSLKIWGQVTENNGKLIEGVVVNLLKNGQIKQTILTDADGKFELNADSAGSYQLEFRNRSYLLRTIVVSTENVLLRKGLTIRLEQLARKEKSPPRVMMGPPPHPNYRKLD